VIIPPAAFIATAYSLLGGRPASEGCAYFWIDEHSAPQARGLNSGNASVALQRMRAIDFDFYGSCVARSILPATTTR
jgi:hypothetical protein